ncbi:MerR family transcriptional regulator [Kocuria sp. JC486]|nr:MerR family transcriptional regulator [Kocuria sp. JC486]NHU86223.1 MerR family transcriptional regulator [Kocuria sp. JC486]
MGALLKQLQPEFPEVTASKVRFLEDQGLLHPARTPSGYRKFAPEDLERLRHVLILQRERYLPLKVIRELSEAGQLEALVQGADGGGEAAAPAPAPSSDGAAQEPEAAAVGTAAPVGATAHQQAPVEQDEPLTMRELCRQSGAGIPLVRELISFGLLHERAGGFDRHDLVIAGAARALRDHGVEPRHLRTLRQAADREIGLVEQAIAPEVAKRSSVAAKRASERAGEITQLCLSIHASMVVGRLEAIQDRLDVED